MTKSNTLEKQTVQTINPLRILNLYSSLNYPMDSHSAIARNGSRHQQVHGCERLPLGLATRWTWTAQPLSVAILAGPAKSLWMTWIRAACSEDKFWPSLVHPANVKQIKRFGNISLENYPWLLSLKGSELATPTPLSQHLHAFDWAPACIRLSGAI